jgi:coenzyme Q-binding protein COQ10
MFALVADIESYSEFVPMCSSVRIRRTMSSGEGVVSLLAEMNIGYKFITESFSCRVTLDRPRYKIIVEYIDGPFRFLENRWTFADDGAGGCDVGFYINYEFKNRAFALLAGAVFDSVFRKMVESFETRADEIYGEGNGVLP